MVGGAERNDTDLYVKMSVQPQRIRASKLKVGLCRSERISWDRQCPPETGFVSNLSPGLLRDTGEDGITTAGQQQE